MPGRSEVDKLRLRVAQAERVPAFAAETDRYGMNRCPKSPAMSLQSAIGRPFVHADAFAPSGLPSGSLLLSTASSDTPSRGPFLAIWSALTIFVSAFLLFQVQPIISKTILPWFGGTPAVWTTCMLFFQVLLLGGYAYAHAISHYLPASKQGSVHAILLVLGLLTLPINPGEYWKPDGANSPVLQILVLLACKVGIPYLLLSSTGPLVQAWFSMIYPGRSPFRLYALSNIGSLGALLSYPFVFEPWMTVAQQGYGWSACFVLFVVLGMVLGGAIWKLPATEEASKENRSAANVAETMDSGESPSVFQGAMWVALAALASLMLLAVTNHVCQDIAVIPFLWVVPLSLYLLSFIISFDSPRWYSRRFYGTMGFLTIALLVVMERAPEIDKTFIWFQTPLKGVNIPFTGRDVAVKQEPVEAAENGSAEEKKTERVYRKFPVGMSTIVDGTLASVDDGLRWSARRVGAVDKDNIPKWKLEFRIGDFSDSMYAQALFYFGMLFLVCMLCHGELVKTKPSAKHLTMFYMLISLGGALGGITVGLISPLFFLYSFELPLGIVCGFILAWNVLAQRDIEARKLGPVKGVFLVGAAIIGSALVYSTVAARPIENEILRARNFFGSISVKDVYGVDPSDPSQTNVKTGRALYHGRILHGFQYVTPSRIDEPTTYYAETSGAGLSVQQFPRENNRPIRVAVVGLGTGTMAAHARFGDEYRFYDIDPKVIALSESGSNSTFTFVSRARDRGALVDIVLGDARISMEREAKQLPRGLELDVLVLDAFSGDAIPAHLLTVEAMKIYEHHMAKGDDGKSTGIIAIHISNRFIDLKPVVASLAEEFEYPITLIHDDDHGDQGDTSSEWVLLTRNEPFQENWSVKVGREPNPEPLFKQKVRWTDQQSNLFEILKK